MNCNYNKYRMALVLHLIAVIFFPSVSFSQDDKPTRNSWSFDYIHNASKNPIIQRAMLDSIHKKLNFIHPGGGSGTVENGISIIDPSLLKGIRKNLDVLQNFSGNDALFFTNLPAFYSLKQLSVANIQQSTNIRFQDIFAHTVYDNSSLTGNNIISYAGMHLNTQIANVPFTYEGSWQYPSFITQDFHVMQKISFDKERMLKGLRQQLTEKFNLEKVLLKDFDFQQLFRQYARSSMDKLKEELSGLHPGLSSLPGMLTKLSPEEFLYLDHQQLKERLFGKKLLDSLSERKDWLKMESNSNRPFSEDRDRQLQEVEIQLTDINKVVEKVRKVKAQFESGGMNYKQLVRYQQELGGNIDEIISSDKFVKESSDKLLRLSGLNRFFLHVREMNIGQFSQDWSKGSLAGIMSSGLGGSILKKEKFAALNISHTLPLGWIKDNPFASNLFDPSTSIQAVRLGKGETNESHSHVSLINSNTRPNKVNQPGFFPVLPRNVFVGSFSKRISLGKSGDLETEISKSSSQFRNTYGAGANDLESKMAFRHFGEDLMQTIALGINYSGNFSKIDLKPTVSLNYAGMGYSNPASRSQVRGSLSYMAGVQKSFFAGKLSMQSRFSQRHSSSSVGGDVSLGQQQSSFIAKYKISRKIKLGINWTGSELFKKYGGGSKDILYGLDRIGVDFSMRSKVGKSTIYHFTAIGYQDLKMDNPDLNTSGQTVWMNSSSSLSMSAGTASLNWQLFNQMKTAPMPGDFLSFDAGWSWLAFKKINITVAGNYLDQPSIARQIGVRQTINCQWGERLSLSVFGDFRKNIIENKNNFLFPSSRGEIEINYKLK